MKSLGKIAAVAIGLVVLIVILFSLGNLFEDLDAQHVMVIQSPVSGTLTWHTTPGVKWQGFGRVTKYPRRGQFWFSKDPNQGSSSDQSITIRFNDGAHAQISGSISYDYPMSEEALTRIHKQYGSEEAVSKQLIETVVQKAVYMSGPLVSSKESYAERRNDLLQIIADQIQLGIYKTTRHEVKETDPLSGEQKTITKVEIVADGGKYLREEKSPLEDYNIRTSNLSLNTITYEKTVEDQIQAQQKATMDVQTAAAQAKKAEQDAITAAKNGEAEAAKAKWLQEAIKAKEVTQAEQELAVAKLNRETAEQKKLEQIALGQGESERRKLVMQADGALEQKLEAYVTVNKNYAEAFSKMQQPIVPAVVFGGNNSGGGSNSAQGLMDMLQAKTALELGLQVNSGTFNPHATSAKK